MKNSEVVVLLRKMPEEIDVEDLIYRIHLLQELEAAESAASQGRILSHEEVVKRSDEWMK